MRYQVICFKDLFYDHQGMVAGIIGTLVDITRLKESERHQRDLLFQTISALASAISHKDRNSAGHELRVRDLALAIGQAMQLRQERLDALGLAAMVHNIGLLQIPTEIITRPRGAAGGVRTDQAAPQAGHDILKQIDFPGPSPP